MELPGRGKNRLSELEAFADYYVDDRAVHFSGDWNSTLAEIKRREKDDRYYEK